MSNRLLIYAGFIILLAACAPASSSRSADPASRNAQIETQPPARAVAISDDTTGLPPINTLADKKPLSIMDLPQTEDGDIVLAGGYYESDFKSYCLQPGNPAPSASDAYRQAPLESYRKDIIETILRNSLKKPYLEQKNIQLLIWAVVSKANYNKLSSPVKSTASQLLTPKQIFELKGGWMGVVQTVSNYVPDAGLLASYNSMKQLFEMGTSSYEAFERIAVPPQPAIARPTDLRKDKWHKLDDSYYVRYFPNGYKNVKIQVYVPEGTVDSTGKRAGNYLLFDPITVMAIPASANSQHLGIGAPSVDVVRRVIPVQKDLGNANTRPGQYTNPKKPH